MNESNEDEHWLTNWEQQCVESIETQPDYDQTLLNENDNVHRKMWTSFQDSATSIAQLYRDRYTGDPASLWVQFQTAAGTVTSLYRESCDSLKKTNELAKQSGHQKRTSEILHWAKRRRRLIRREDLLAYLAGKPLPPRQNHHHHHHHRLSPRPRNTSPPPGDPTGLPDHDPSLRTFREALARTQRLPSLGNGTVDLCTFITGEMARHCKRPASPSDVPMGSPTQQKRPRFMCS